MTRERSSWALGGRIVRGRREPAHTASRREGQRTATPGTERLRRPNHVASAPSTAASVLSSSWPMIFPTLSRGYVAILSTMICERVRRPVTGEGGIDPKQLRVLRIRGQRKDDDGGVGEKRVGLHDQSRPQSPCNAIVIRSARRKAQPSHAQPAVSWFGAQISENSLSAAPLRTRSTCRCASARNAGESASQTQIVIGRRPLAHKAR